jgi:hypothetical protein
MAKRQFSEKAGVVAGTTQAGLLGLNPLRTRKPRSSFPMFRNAK